ncbi:MAG: 1-acyl-sn-glycerol-3-phosphate acyltransferase [Candidatus Omnitrophica bacterium]|nr:1-acyl-sn-glycerol-3-phosphate acyltransferase [Candidatus Omnitrophota bacterium]
MIYWITWFILRVISYFLFPIKTCGRENIPQKGGLIFASNHRSNLDPVLIPIACFRRCDFVAKDSLFKNNLFGRYLKRLGAFPIRREVGDVGALKEAIKRLKNGKAVVIFPEGTRVIEENDRQIQPGVGLIAAKAGKTIVPVFIEGSDKAMPPGAKFIKRNLISITYGKPIDAGSFKGLSYPEIATKIMREILKLRG